MAKMTKLESAIEQAGWDVEALERELRNGLDKVQRDAKNALENGLTTTFVCGTAERLAEVSIQYRAALDHKRTLEFLAKSKD